MYAYDQTDLEEFYTLLLEDVMHDDHILDLCLSLKSVKSPEEGMDAVPDDLSSPEKKYKDLPNADQSSSMSLAPKMEKIAAMENAIVREQDKQGKAIKLIVMF